MPRLRQLHQSLGVIAAAAIASQLFSVAARIRLAWRGRAMPTPLAKVADSRNRPTEQGIPRVCLGALDSRKHRFAASAQGPLGSRQPSVRPSSRNSPRHRVSVPGSPSDLRPRNPPCLAVMRMASRKLGAGASGGRFLNLIS